MAKQSQARLRLDQKHERLKDATRVAFDLVEEEQRKLAQALQELTAKVDKDRDYNRAAHKLLSRRITRRAAVDGHLRRRLEWLELPWWTRAWRRVTRRR